MNQNVLITSGKLSISLKPELWECQLENIGLAIDALTLGEWLKENSGQF